MTTKTPEELARELVAEYADDSWQSPLAALTKIAEKYLRQYANERIEDGLKQLEVWCETQGQSLGAVDGYDYNSGLEYAFRSAAIEISKRRKELKDKPS